MFHGLVNASAILLIHLVKLIDQANTLIRQHQSSALQSPRARDGVLVHSGCETHSRGTLAGSEDTARSSLLGVLQALRLGRAWIS